MEAILKEQEEITTISLPEMVRKLAKTRNAATFLKNELKDKREAFDAENTLLIASCRTADQEVADLEATVKAAAIAAFHNDSSTKKITPGVTITVGTPKPIYDADKALAWAEVNAPICVVRTLDTKKFETICTDPKVVTMPEPPVSARLDSDLQKALGEI